jgi:hypothetical protein
VLIEQGDIVSCSLSNQGSLRPRACSMSKTELHKRPPSSCIYHSRSINSSVSSDSSKTLIWPLNACRSSRIKTLGFIAVDFQRGPGAMQDSAACPLLVSPRDSASRHIR